jgi:hypothetical protein
MRVLIVLAILAATALAQEDSQNYFVKATTNVYVHPAKSWSWNLHLATHDLNILLLPPPK